MEIFYTNMSILLILAVVIPTVAITAYCFVKVNDKKNKDENGYNAYNSTLGVQCNAKEKCDWRFSTSCESCAHNCGPKKSNVSYEPRT